MVREGGGSEEEGVFCNGAVGRSVISLCDAEGVDVRWVMGGGSVWRGQLGRNGGMGRG